MSERGYKVVYKDRNRDDRPRRDYYPDPRYNDYQDSRELQLTRTTESGRSGKHDIGGRSTKTVYGVARDGNADARLTRGDVVVLDHPRDRVESMSDSSWEVVRPERDESGAFVIESGGRSYGQSGRRHDYEYDDRRRPPPTRDFEPLSPPRRRQRSRSRSRGLAEAMSQVQVTVDSSDDERKSGVTARSRGRRSQATIVADDSVSVRGSVQRRPSAFHHDHSPESDVRRRSRSVGFFREQCDHHDAAECRHERPGAESHLAGRYLVNHRGERGNPLDDHDDRRSRGHRHDREFRDGDNYQVDERLIRRRGDDVVEDFEYHDYERKAPYDPQRPVEVVEEKEKPHKHRRRHHRHHRHHIRDEDADSVLVRTEKTTYY